MEGGTESYRRINLVGLNRREGRGYGDCKQGVREVNRLACKREVGEPEACDEIEQDALQSAISNRHFRMDRHA